MSLSMSVHASCLEAQRDELAVLESILGPDFVESSVGLRWRIAADIGSERVVTLLPWRAQLRLQFLPDIVACATLPPLYPEEQPPNFYIDCHWIPRAVLSQWVADATALWSPGSVCLYNVYLMLQQGCQLFVSQLQQLDFSRTFASATSRDVDCDGAGTCDAADGANDAVALHSDAINLDRVRHMLVTFDARRSDDAFRTSYYTCPVCIETKTGSSCYRFITCRHVACRSCVSSYFASMITEGSVSVVGCPFTSCRAPPLDVELKALVPPDVYERYERLTLERSLVCDGAVDCPLCKKPAWPEHPPPPVAAGAGALTAHATSAYRNLARCGYCGYSFCLLCRTPWHLGRRCTSKDLNKLLATYRSAEDSERQRLEDMFSAELVSPSCPSAALPAPPPQHVFVAFSVVLRRRRPA